MLVSTFGLFAIPQIADSLRLEWLSSFPPTLLHRLVLPTGMSRFLSTVIRAWITLVEFAAIDFDNLLDYYSTIYVLKWDWYNKQPLVRAVRLYFCLKKKRSGSVG